MKNTKTIKHQLNTSKAVAHLIYINTGFNDYKLFSSTVNFDKNEAERFEIAKNKMNKIFEDFVNTLNK